MVMSQPLMTASRVDVEWMSQAVCASITDWEDQDQGAQIEVCRRWCPVAVDCLEYALAHRPPRTKSACVVYGGVQPSRLGRLRRAS